MTDIRERIIETIRRNRISTTEVADCLGKTGVIKNVVILNPGHFQVGPIRFAYAYNRSNWELHEQLQHVLWRECRVQMIGVELDETCTKDLVLK